MRSNAGWKLAVMILAVGLTACTLLAFRQERLQAAHELARAQQRMRRHDDEVLRLRARVLSEYTPERFKEEEPEPPEAEVLSLDELDGGAG